MQCFADLAAILELRIYKISEYYENIIINGY